MLALRVPYCFPPVLVPGGAAAPAAPAAPPAAVETIIDASIADTTDPKPLRVLTARWPVSVEARFTIDRVGRPQGIETGPADVPDELHAQARAALERWRFWPALGACRYAEQHARLTIVFEEERVQVGQVEYAPITALRTLSSPDFAWLDPADPGDSRPRQRTARAGFVETVPLKHVPPRFPAQASRSALPGYAWVMLEVGTDGKVAKAKVNDAWSPDPVLAPLFGAEAVRAVKQWRFQPAMQDGKSLRRTACQRFLFNMKLGG